VRHPHCAGGDNVEAVDEIRKAGVDGNMATSLASGDSGALVRGSVSSAQLFALAQLMTLYASTSQLTALWSARYCGVCVCVCVRVGRDEDAA
jgi:hypothetical protein